jgi:hypothetical protein
VIPFLEARPFRPNLILENVHLFPFDNLTCMLLAHWEIVGELFLPNLTPPVLILRIIPLFPPEAALAEQLGDVRVLSQLRNKGLVYEDFERKSLVH